MCECVGVWVFFTWILDLSVGYWILKIGMSGYAECKPNGCRGRCRNRVTELNLGAKELESYAIYMEYPARM